MNGELPAALMREGFLTLAAVAAPYVVTLLVVGLAIGVLQAATQINDPAVGFLPRLTAAVGLAAAIGAWTLERLAGFFAAALHRMAERL